MLLRLPQRHFSEGTTNPCEAAVAMVVKAMAREGARRHAPDKAAKVASIQRLVDAEAWTDAALALIDLEQPHWGLRRLSCEDGEWFCTLASHPGLPIEMAETAEARNELPAAAILQAFFEARERAGGKREAPSTRVPQIRPQRVTSAVSCENFG